MGSLRFSAAQDIFESKRCNFYGNSFLSGVDLASSNSWVSSINIGYVVDWKKEVRRDVKCCGLGVDSRKEEHLLESIWGIQLSTAVGINRWSTNPKVRLKNTKVHGLEGIGESQLITDLVKKSQTSHAGHASLLDPSMTWNKSVPNMVNLHDTSLKNSGDKRTERKIWKRLLSSKKSARREVSKPILTKKARAFEFARNDHEVEFDLSAISSSSSMEQCNFVLKRLEKKNDEKTINFFEWMRSNGKLKENTDAYHIVLRAVARKEDWSRAKSLLEEMTVQSACELNVQVFNSLIYVCAKRGIVWWGTKWFQMMLERGVQPNIATIGMLMGLYQKRSCLRQAECVFSTMRRCKLKCVSAYSAMITIYTRLRLYAKSEETINLMKKDEVLPNVENWLVQLNAYSQQGKLEEAELVMKSMLQAGISPNIVAYNTLITGHGKMSNTEAAKSIFQSLHLVGLVPDETTYRSMIEGFGRVNNYVEALFYYQELKRLGFQPSSSNFYTMINLQARYGDEEGAIQTLKDMRAAGCQCSSIVGSLLQAYERVGRLDNVLPTLEASFYEDILLDPTSCSILVMAYIQNSLLDDALQVLRDKRWEDSDFEDNLYHLLICSCKEAGSYENAVKIYDQMPRSEMQINLHITSSMIDVFSAMDRFTDAENLYLKLKSSGSTLDMIAYSIFVRMYIKAGRLKDACLVLDMMEKQKDIVPDTYLFRDMLRTYQRCGMLEKLSNVYYWILKTGIKWDEAMYNCIINCCGRALPVDELSRLFDEMIHHGYSANTITLNVMLDVYGKAGLLKKARKVFWMARKQGLADIISYNTIIAAYGQSKDFKSMRSLIQRMQQAGYPISLEAYNCMLDAYGKEDQLEEFNHVLQNMKEAKCDSDHYTYNIMINIYGKKGWIEEVANVLAELKDRGLEPDLYSYNTLIKAYGVAGMAEEAVNVVQEMRIRRINPDRVTYTNLIAALQRNENFLEAVKWSLWMKQMDVRAENTPATV
ncbi:pentatricopeptide repeat-containing protein At4g30825, chloroplastic [Typha latifolia]|uniref:pentatricopeptide repeat-containing protein At4g30825, chloroplastic n=1 Tax=Typha latifolia TaxID=4733 RepID=UPI003C2E6AE9